MYRPPIDCFVPPAPQLQARILRTRELALSGGQLPDHATVDILDMRSFTLIATRPSTRANAFFNQAALRAPVTGTRRALVLLVDFSDFPASRTQQHFNDLLFSVGSYASGSMRDYYREVSYNKLDVVGLVSGADGGWYRAPETKAFYTNNEYGFGSYPRNAQKLVEDLVDLAAPFVNYADYDNDGDGIVDALVIVAAGSGAEVTGNTGHFWSHKWEINPRVFNGVRIQRYNLQPEDGRIGVFAHELGHLLLGLPDLYDIDGTSAGTGAWDLMAGGTWNGGGDTPAHPTCWCKVKVGWINPVTLFDLRQSISLPPYAASDLAYRLPIGSPDSKEYFLLTNRHQGGFDRLLPGSGLIIEHVDDTRTGNTDENHYLVDIEQADGRRDLNKNANHGDGGDSFPQAGNTAFTASSTPASLSYAGIDAQIEVAAIQRNGDSITADIRVGTPNALQWYSDRAVRATFVHHTTQWAWAEIEGLGWRRVKSGAADGVTNAFMLLCSALADNRKVTVYADAELIHTLYLN